MRTTKKDAAVVAGLSMPEPVKVRLADVQFATYNPRVMPAEEMKSLKASLIKHGLVLNLIIQKKGNVLIGGHQRVRAMRELCKEKNWPEPEFVWATVLDVPDKVAKQLNIALNKISGEFDPYKLGQMFSSMSMTADDVLAVGFSSVEIAELVKLTVPPDTAAAALEAQADDDLGGFGRSITLTVEFATVEARDAMKARLGMIAKERGVKAGEVLATAMDALASRS